jgi:hypothetical protein
MTLTAIRTCVVKIMQIYAQVIHILHDLEKLIVSAFHATRMEPAIELGTGTRESTPHLDRSSSRYFRRNLFE